jgi:prepilin-type N-terminal cleavage/methylation domain-containing protein
MRAIFWVTNSPFRGKIGEKGAVNETGARWAMTKGRGFTLVEILVVVVIIGILVTLVTVAVKGAMDATKRAKIATQMSQLAMALDHYKAEIGEYPPDLFDDEALVRHVKKRWPRLVLPSGGLTAQADFIRNSINEAYDDALTKAFGNAVKNEYGNVDFTMTSTLSPVGSLALWLGGFPNGDGKLSGFYADPENPFTQIETFDRKAFADLEFGENKSVRPFCTGNNLFVPAIGNDIRDAFVPIIYFQGLPSGGLRAYMIPDGGHPKRGEVKQFDFRTSTNPIANELGFCVAYAEEESAGVIKWKNPTTFQLLHPGLDGIFGIAVPGGGAAPLRIIKTGNNIVLQDLDNQTNFSDYKELKSILP